MFVLKHFPHWTIAIGLPFVVSSTSSCSSNYYSTTPATTGTGGAGAGGAGGGTDAGPASGGSGAGGADAGAPDAVQADVVQLDVLQADVQDGAVVDAADALVTADAQDSSTPPVCVPSSPPVEICNDKDDDCNGVVDDGCPRGPVWATGTARPPIGDSMGGSPFSETCAADEVLVGLRVAAAGYVTQVRGVCRKYVVKPAPNGDLTGAGIVLGPTRELPPHPTTTMDPIHDLICADSKILVGIRMSQQSFTVGGSKGFLTPRIWGICADPALTAGTARFEWQSTSEIGPVSGSYANIMDWLVSDRVASPNVLVGVHGFSGTRIDRVGISSSVFAMSYCTGVYAIGPNPMNRVNWTATASTSSQNPSDAIVNAFDASTTSRWSSGRPQSGSEWFKLDLGGVGCVSGVSLTAPGGDFPARYSVSLSVDDRTYVPVASGVGQNTITVDFPSRDARYVRINQTGSSYAWWSIADISVQK